MSMVTQHCILQPSKCFLSFISEHGYYSAEYFLMTVNILTVLI